MKINVMSKSFIIISKNNSSIQLYNQGLQISIIKLK